MANIVREDIGNLHAILSVSLSPSDYQPKVDSELGKYRKKAQMKGFRKGKTPMGLIRKRFGKAVLADVINEQLQNELMQYLKEENIDILGQPLPAEDQEQLDFDNAIQDEVLFRFEIGMAPEFEVKGVDNDNKFEQYSVEVPDEMIMEDLQAAQKRVGQRSEVEDPIEENDMVRFNAEELDGEKLKEGGWASTFSIVVDEKINDDVRDQLLKLKKGDKLRFNIKELEKERDEAYVRKYLLNVGDEDQDTEIGADFEGSIEEVTRVMPAELNQEFFDKYFGEGKISSVEEAKSKIEEEIKKYYDRQAESLLFRDFQDDLLEKNQIEMPEKFLRRWLMVANNLQEADVDRDYENFSKNLVWSMIRRKLMTKFDLQVSEEELLEGFKDRIRSYFGGYGDELVILNTANRLMQDEKQADQLYQELMADKIFDAIKKEIEVTPKKISKADFEEVLRKAQEELAASRAAAAVESLPESAEEEEEVADVEE